MEEYDYFEEGLADGLIEYGIVEDYTDSLDLASYIYNDMYTGNVRMAANKVEDFEERHNLTKEQRLDLVEKLSRIAIYAKDLAMGNGEILENELGD